MERVDSITIRAEPRRSVSSMLGQKKWLPAAAILGAVFLWGASFSAMRAAVGAFNPWSVICAMICAAANMLIVKRLCDRYNPWTLTALQVIVGAIFFIPGLFPLIRADAAAFTPGLAAALLFLGAFVTLGAFGIYNWGMSHIPASRASMFINLVPVTAVLFGWTLLGESLTAIQGLAALLVVLGVWWSQYAGR